MATFRPKGRIDVDCVDKEIERLRLLWSGQADNAADILSEIFSNEQIAEFDPFDRVQLAEAIRICRTSRSHSEAGRTLFNASRYFLRSGTTASSRSTNLLYGVEKPTVM